MRTCLHSYNGCSVFSSLMTVPKQRSCVFEDRAKCGTRTWTPISETEHALQQSKSSSFFEVRTFCWKTFTRFSHIPQGYGIRDTGYGIRDTGYGIRDAGCGIRDTGYGIREEKGEKAVFNPNIITYNKIVRSRRQGAVRALAVESSQPAVHVSGVDHRWLSWSYTVSKYAKEVVREIGIFLFVTTISNVDG